MTNPLVPFQVKFTSEYILGEKNNCLNVARASGAFYGDTCTNAPGSCVCHPLCGELAFPLPLFLSLSTLKTIFPGDWTFLLGEGLNVGG